MQKHNINSKGEADHLNTSYYLADAVDAEHAALCARIAELEAGLAGMVHASDVFFRDSGYPVIFHSGYISTARKLLANKAQS